jgi:hypothetical protein
MACVDAGGNPAAVSTGGDAGALDAGPLAEGGAVTVTDAGAAGGEPADTGTDAIDDPLPQAAAPTFTPPGGAYDAAQSVTIRAPVPGATIYYTTDGHNPTTASTPYTTPISVADGTTPTTIRAFFVAPGFAPSVVAAATYTIAIKCSCTEPVEFSLWAGTYDNALMLFLSTVRAGATICYTFGTAPPTCNLGACTGGTMTYSGGYPLAIDAPVGGGSRTVNALDCGPTISNGDTVTQTYTFRAAPVSTSVPPGTVASGTTVTLSTATLGASVHVTSDGTNPTCDAADAGLTDSKATITIQRITTVKAIACRANYQPSAVASFTYTF